MTLREAMKLLELNERTLDISMLDSAARQRMDNSESSLERDQILEAYRRVQIFLDPSADERFTMRGSNVLAALSETREESLVSAKQSPAFDQDHEVVMVEDISDASAQQNLTPEPLAALFDANDTTFDYYRRCGWWVCVCRGRVDTSSHRELYCCGTGVHFSGDAGRAGLAHNAFQCRCIE